MYFPIAKLATNMLPNASLKEHNDVNISFCTVDNHNAGASVLAS